MSRRIRKAVCVLAILPLAACGTARIPSDAVAVVTPLSLGPPPIYSLLGYRQELDLTSEQVAALDSIAQAVQAENRELVEELRKASEGNRSGLMVVRPNGEPILQEIQANHRQAGEAIEKLLDEEQKASVCELFERPDQGRRGEGGRRRQAQPDPRYLQPAGWPWCEGGEARDGERLVGGNGGASDQLP